MNMADHSVAKWDQEQAQRGSSNVWWKVAVVGLLIFVSLQSFGIMILLEQNKELMVTTQGMNIKYESHIKSLEREKEEYATLLKQKENSLMALLVQNKEFKVTTQGMKVKYESHIKSLEREKEENAALLKKMENNLMVLLEQNKELMVTTKDMKVKYESHIKSLKREKEEYAALLKKMENELMVQLKHNNELMTTIQKMETRLMASLKHNDELMITTQKMENRLGKMEEVNEGLVGDIKEMQKQHRNNAETMQKQRDALMKKVEKLEEEANSYTQYVKTAAAGFAGAAIGNLVTGGLSGIGKAGFYLAGEVGSKVLMSAN